MEEVREESSSHCPQAKIYIFSWVFSVLENLLLSPHQPFSDNCPPVVKHSPVRLEFAHLPVSGILTTLSLHLPKCYPSLKGHISTVSRNLRGLIFSSSKPWSWSLLSRDITTKHLLPQQTPCKAETTYTVPITVHPTLWCLAKSRCWIDSWLNKCTISHPAPVALLDKTLCLLQSQLPQLWTEDNSAWMYSPGVLGRINEWLKSNLKM